MYIGLPPLGIPIRSMGGFSPASIPNLALWLDAADSSTITLDGSNNIEQLRDKSGNLRHANQGTALRRPGLGAINGKQAANFDGTDDVLLVTHGAWADLPSYSIYVVTRPTNTSLTFRGWTGKELGGADRKFLLGNDSGGGLFYNSSPTLDSISISGGSVYTNNVGLLISAHKNGNTNARAFVNGILFGTDAAVTTGTNAADIAIGSGTNGGYAWPGQIGEYLIYADNHDDTTRGLIQNYLAAKWLGSVAGVIAPALWLDASDTSTITLDGSNNVSEWRDKSGNGRHSTQATALSRPAYTPAAVNGRNAITFDAVDDFLSCYNAAGPATWFIVHKWSGGNRDTRLGGHSVARGVSFGIASPTSWNISFVRDSIAWLPSGFSQGTSTRLYRVGYETGSSSFWTYNGGVETLRQTALLSGILAGPAGLSMPGDHCEVIVFDRILVAAEIAAIEAYLAAKWGIA
jgi:hypothetical protein